MTEHKRPDNAVATARPTGKRQVTGAATNSEAYKAKQARGKESSDEQHGGGVTAFFPEVVQEMRKVIWPTARQMVVYTSIVFAFLIITTALVAGVDFLAGMGVEKVLTR